MTETSMKIKLPVACFILQIILIILFGTLVEYDSNTDAKLWHEHVKNGSDNYENEFYFRYPSKFSNGRKSVLHTCRGMHLQDTQPG